MPDPTLIIADVEGVGGHEAEPIMAALIDSRLELRLDDGRLISLGAADVLGVLDPTDDGEDW